VHTKRLESFAISSPSEKGAKDDIESENELHNKSKSRKLGAFVDGGAVINWNLRQDAKEV